MFSHFRKLITLVVIGLAVQVMALARTDLDTIKIGAQQFNVEVSYEEEKAYAGNTNLPLRIVITTKGTNNLSLIKCGLPEGKILFTQISEDPSADPVTGLLTTEYRYRADINETADPKVFLIPMSFSFPNEKNISREFSLNVGVRSNGKLRAVTDQTETPQFFTGCNNTFRLELENNFPDYPVRVRSIGVKSDPAGLIENAMLPQDISIDPLQRKSVDLSFKVAPMSFSNLLGGFRDSSRLILDITYDDSHGRTITDLKYPVKISVRPRDRLLVVAMVIGVIIGAIIKLYLQRLQQRGVISRREALMAVVVTSVIGLVVSFIAVVGRIKIIAFDQIGSYDNPGVIFIISLSAAVGGAQLLSTFLRMRADKADKKEA